MSILPEGWDRLLGRPFEREPFRTTLLRAESEAAAHRVFPPREDWFAAFRLTPPEAVRAVILGQDPYHEPGQAMGLAFSVRPGVRLPPSLRNMYRELTEDLGCPAPSSGDLTPWAEQGVLLLNTVLTVEAGKANSHRDLGWQSFTREVLSAVSRLPQPVAFVLWGSQAQGAFAQATGSGQQAAVDEYVAAHTKCATQATGNGQQATGDGNPVEAVIGRPPAVPRLILSSAHPSPLSAYRGFFGSRPYSGINAFLRENGLPEIRWA